METRHMAIHAAVAAIAVSPDGRFVAVGGSDELGGVAVFPTACCN